MKKLFSIILVLTFTVLSLTSCEFSDIFNQLGSKDVEDITDVIDANDFVLDFDDPELQGKNIFEVLDILTEEQHDNATVSVTSQIDNDVLNSEYIIGKNDDVYNVFYSYEVLNKINVIGDTVTLPESPKTQYTGNIKVKGNRIIEAQGASINISTDLLTSSGLSFNPDYFASVKLTKGKFYAKVKDVQGFIGEEIDSVVNDSGTVTVYFNTSITAIEITYRTAGSINSTNTYNYIYE